MPTCVRASAETMPCVTVCPTPNGLPIASTMSPTCSASELANSNAGNCSLAFLSRNTARSVRLSLSTISASNSRLSASATLISSAPSITCTLVTTRPLGSTITPEPSERCTWFCVARHAEEAAEDRIVEQRVAVLHHLGGVDVDHRGRDLLDQRGVRQPQVALRRHAPFLSGGGGGTKPAANAPHSVKTSSAKRKVGTISILSGTDIERRTGRLKACPPIRPDLRCLPRAPG